MGFLDSLFGSAPARKSTSGPHVTRNRKLGERRQRMAETDAAVAKNSAAAGERDAAAADLLKAKAKDERKKKISKGFDFLQGLKKGEVRK